MSQDKPNPKARHIQTSALDQDKIKGINEQLHRIQQIKSAKLRRSSDQPKKEDIEELPLETVDSMIGFATQGDMYRNDLDLLFDRITGEAEAPVYQAPEPELEPIAPPAAAMEALPSASKNEESLPHENSNGGFEFVPSEQPSGGFEFDMSGGSGGLDDGDFDLDNLQLDLSFMNPEGSSSAPEGEAGGFEFDMSGGEGGAEPKPAAPSKPVSLLERVATPTPQPQILGGYSLNELEQLKSLSTPSPTHSKGSSRVTSDDTAPQPLVSNTLVSNTLVSNTLVSNTLVSNTAPVELEGGSFEPFDFNELQDAEVEVLPEDTNSEELEMDALASLMDFAEPAGAVEDASTSPGSLLEGDDERDMWRDVVDEGDDD